MHRRKFAGDDRDDLGGFAEAASASKTSLGIVLSGSRRARLSKLHVVFGEAKASPRCVKAFVDQTLRDA